MDPAFPRRTRVAEYMVATVSFALALAQAAAAHEIITGVSGVASLALHPFVSVETALVLIASALVAGVDCRVRGFLALLAVAAAGAAAGFSLQAKALLVPGLWRLPLVVALGLGGVTVASLRLPPSVTSLLVFLAAVTVGVGIAPERSGLAGGLEVVAATTMAMGIVLMAVALGERFTASRLLAVGLRVAGAWIVAISVLALGVSLR